MNSSNQTARVVGIVYFAMRAVFNLPAIQNMKTTMIQQEIKETVQDEIELERRERETVRQEFYREFSMHGGDGPWNNYGGDGDDNA